MKKKRGLRSILIIIDLLVLVTVCAVLVTERISGMQASKTQNEARDLLEQGRKAAQSRKTAQSIEISDEPLQKTVSDEADGTEDTLPEVQSDFLPLLEKNGDFVGWLTAGDTIDYPVVQSDNTFYLTHNFFGETDSNGAPFLDGGNQLLPRDDVLIIYGHNMKSGALFGRLKRYSSLDYVSRNPIISFRTIYDAEDVYYTPIAALNISTLQSNKNYFNVRRFSFADDPTEGTPEETEREEFQAYLDEISGRSEWTPKTDVSVNDNLLMLVTCSYFYGDGRLLLVCRELRADETPESITALYQNQQHT